MGVGDVTAVSAGTCSELYHVDTGMYGTSEYGAAYLLDAERPAIVETGIGTNHDLILAMLDEVGVAREDLEAILVTHIHLDHAGGAGFLAEACPNADVYVPAVGADHLVEPTRLVEGTKAAVGDQWEFYVEPEPVPEDRIVPIEEGDEIDLGDRALRVHAAPGHAPHQVVFEWPDARAVFTGDAAGIWVPRIGEIKETSPPAQFDLEGCLEDVETLKAIDPDVLCYTHFGTREVDDEAGAVLDEYAAVLGSWVAAVERAREEFDEDEAVIEHFTNETEMDDVWGERKARAETAMNVRGVVGYLDWRDG